MPTYIFRNIQNEEITERIMSISAREKYLKENPHMTTIIQSPMIVSGVSTSNSKANKVPTGFGEVLSKVAEAHPTSVVGERYGKKSIKEIKTRDIVKSHVKKLTKLANK
jgi:hypothetical protein